MNGILLLNKPAGLTSFAVVAKLRKILQLKQIGHTGTLDPQAEGLLQILVGKATKLNQFLLSEPKEYIATIQLGFQTDTEDIWGNKTQEKPLVPYTKAQLTAVLASFLGESYQLPPMYSAVSVAGKRLYEYARENQIIKREPRLIYIYDLELLAWTSDTLQLRISCSSGTYIRTLCQAIALKLDNFGVMSQLLRTKIANSTLTQAYTLAEIAAGQFEMAHILTYLNHFPQIDIADPTPIYQGKPFLINRTEPRLLLTYQNEPLAIYQLKKEAVYHSERGLW